MAFISPKNREKAERALVTAAMFGAAAAGIGYWTIHQIRRADPHVPMVMVEHIAGGKLDPGCIGGEAAKSSLAKTMEGEKASAFSSAVNANSASISVAFALPKDDAARHDAAKVVVEALGTLLFDIDRQDRVSKVRDAVYGERISNLLFHHPNSLIGLEAIDRACAKE